MFRDLVSRSIELSGFMCRVCTNKRINERDGARGDRNERDEVDGCEAGEARRNMKQSLHWKVKNLLSPSAFDLPLGASVLIVPALSSSSLTSSSSSASSSSSSSSISYSLQLRVSGEVYRLPRAYMSRRVYPPTLVPFSDVSLVAALQRMSTSYCHPTIPASSRPLCTIFPSLLRVVQPI